MHHIYNLYRISHTLSFCYLRYYIVSEKYREILKYFNDFQNPHFSVLWLKWTQTMEMKQNQTFFHVAYSNLTSFFIGHKILKYFIDFGIFQLYWKSEHKQVKWNEIKWDMYKSDSIIPYLQCGALFKWLLKFISW